MVVANADNGTLTLCYEENFNETISAETVKGNQSAIFMAQNKFPGWTYDNRYGH